MTTIFKDQVAFEVYGETIAAGQPLYKSTGTGSDSGRTAGRMYLLDVSNADRRVFYGLAKDAGVAADTNKRVVTAGRAEGFTGLTAGLPVYAGAMAGSYTQVAPTSNVQVLGLAQDSDTLLVNGALGGSFVSSVGSGSGVGSVDILAAQTFDTAAIGDFTQTGLVLSASNPIKGSVSARLIHQPASSQSFKQVIAVDRKFRGQLMQISLQDRSSASEGNLTLLVTDETNAATIMASSPITTGQIQVATAVTTNASATVTGFSNSVINSLRVGMSITGAGIPTATVINSINTTAGSIVMSQNATASATIMAKISALPNRNTFSFTLPANCASFSYTVTALQEAGSPESYIDDIVVELATTALLSTSVVVPVITEWQSYTPTFQGFGTPTGVEAQWRQNGGNVELRGKFTSGTTTAVEARIGLPAGLTSAGTSLIPSIQLIGNFVRGNSGAATQKTSSVLIEPSVSYVTLAVTDYTTANSPLSKSNGNAVLGNTELGSFFASVPVLGLSATTTKTIPLTQAGIVQEADSYLRVTGFTPSVGATATKIISIASGSITQNIGDALQYLDDSTNGARFIAQKAGTYRFGFSADVNNTTPTGMGFSLNSSSLTTNYSVLPASQKIQSGYEAGGSSILSMYGEAYLNVGDTVRIHLDGSLTSPSNSWSTFTASYQGSLRQVTVNPNSKITIPTSELRFEGASSRGAVATAIVKFDTLARIRGDAFSVTNTTNDGTFITMLKAGQLSVSTGFVLPSAASCSISRNQASLTAFPAASEILASADASAAGFRVNMAWAGDVNVGDIIRVQSGAAPTANISNNLNLSFQEQSIQVGITNILPQFSESDSSVRVDTANGYGSTATKIRRFSNVRDNIGVDVEYVDSATNGASFTAKSSGIYNITYDEDSTTAGVFFGISRNSASLATNITSLPASEVLAIQYGATITGVENCSWQGYLSQGDIIRAHTTGNPNGTPDRCRFTMSKVGKPNVTGVNVTPFVNVPQPDSQVIRADSGSAVNNGVASGFVVLQNSGSSLLSAGTSRITALKNCTVSISWSGTVAAAGVRVALYKNGGFHQTSTSAYTSAQITAASSTVALLAGEYLELLGDNSATTTTLIRYALTAEALSDQILTVPETFSTDTASLTYAGSAQYTLATLQNAPVGTFITFTYAGGTNTRTQTNAAAPTQTTADMNANGMLLYTRVYASASTAAQPAAIAVQIGKGLKGVSKNLYKSAAKTIAGGTDYTVQNSTSQAGLYYQDYNEVTGILVIDAGICALTTITSSVLNFSDVSTQTSGYLVINASKNPALTGMNLNRVAARGVNSSAQSIPNSTVTTITYDATKTFDTNGALNSATGVWTCPETGYYQISGGITSASVSWTSGQVFELALTRNGTQVSSYISPISTGSYTASTQVSDTLFFSRGDTVTMTAFHNRGAATALLADASRNKLSISKVSI